jgi:hypothetical protein
MVTRNEMDSMFKDCRTTRKWITGIVVTAFLTVLGLGWKVSADIAQMQTDLAWIKHTIEKDSAAPPVFSDLGERVAERRPFMERK